MTSLIQVDPGTLDGYFPDQAREADKLHYEAPRTGPRVKSIESKMIEKCHRCGHLKGNHERLRGSYHSAHFGPCKVSGCKCKHT